MLEKNFNSKIVEEAATYSESSKEYVAKFCFKVL